MQQALICNPARRKPAYFLLQAPSRANTRTKCLYGRRACQVFLDECLPKDRQFHYASLEIREQCWIPWIERKKDPTPGNVQLTHACRSSRTLAESTRQWVQWRVMKRWLIINIAVALS
jgi:hypothetical protein